MILRILLGIFAFLMVVWIYLRWPTSWRYRHVPYDRKLRFGKRFCEIGGMKICYVDEGRGDRTVLLIHGNSAGIHHWELVLGSLSQRYRCVALDLPGWGDSDKPRIDYTIPFYAKTLVQFLDKIGVDQADVVASSMGGQTAMEVALRFPQRIRRLVLADPGGLWNRSGKIVAILLSPFLNENIFQKVGRPWQEYFIRHHAFCDSSSPACSELVKKQTALLHSKEYPAFAYTLTNSLKHLLRHGLKSEIGKIQHPTLIIWGRQDRLIPWTFGWQASWKIPNAQVKVFDLCGHLPMLEIPDRFVTTVVNFLESPSEI